LESYLYRTTYHGFFAKWLSSHQGIACAIESHHHEADQQTLEAVIIEAADAISGARPGARRENLEQYLHMLRLATIGNMVGGMAHTLNNVLGGILGYAQLQKEELQDLPVPLKHAEIIERAAKRASKLISQLQTFCIKQSNNKKIIDARFLVEQIHDIFDSVFNKRINLNLELQHDSARIIVDIYALSFAFINICHNAKAAMPNGGSLTIRTGKDAATIENKDVEYVTFEFQDTGCGIKKEHLPHITEPFFTTRNAPGMGLTIADEIIKDHDGKLKIHSIPGKGTRVMVWIPVKMPLSELNTVAAVKREAQMRQSSQKQTIMVVDDEADLREMAKTILEKRGYDVLVAGSGHTAVQVFKENLARINLVILDMIMPGMDGAKVYRRLKALSQNSKFILTSGYVNDSPFQEIIDKEEEIFVPKPWDLPHLISEAQRVLAY